MLTAVSGRYFIKGRISRVTSDFPESRSDLGRGAARIDDHRVRAVLPQRDASAHKWGVGGVVVIAGSPSYPGAAAMTCRAAGRAGAGIVMLATSRGVIGTIASAIPEVAYIPIPETESLSGARKAIDLIGEHIAKSRAAVIGPGLGSDDANDGLLGGLIGLDQRGSAVRGGIGFSVAAAPSSPGQTRGALFEHEDLHVVIDADALNWLARQASWWERMPARRAILTPHPGEMSRLLDISTEEVNDDPFSAVTEAASRWNQVVVLKGGYSVVSDGSTTLVADLAAPSLATAGSGDVLAGTIGALVAQLESPLDAAMIALHVGPRAAKRLEERFGVLGVIAPDLPDAIAAELALLSES